MTTDRPLHAPDPQLSDRSSPAKDAALRGAALAFGKPPVKPKPQFKAAAVNDGALAAAREVGAQRLTAGNGSQDLLTTPSKQTDAAGQIHIGRQHTGGSVNGGGKRSTSRPRMSRLESNGFLQPSGTTGSEGRSPSFIAATLAASRSASVSPSVTGQKSVPMELRQKPSFTRLPSPKRNPSQESTDNVLDTTPIPPTTSLIGMFEQNATAKARKKISTVEGKRSRAFSHDSLANEQQGVRKETRTPSPRSKKRTSVSSPLSNNPQYLVSPIPMKPKPKQPLPMLKSDNVPHLEPHPRAKHSASNTEKVSPKSVGQFVRPAAEIDGAPSQDDIASTYHKPTPPPPRKTNTPAQRRLTASSKVSPEITSTNDKINAMANAIVASSLASSRAASPSRQHLQPVPPPPPSRRSPRGIDHLFHSHKEVSRTPSPSKQSTLRTTMRKPRTEPELDEGDKRRSKKHNIMKKHPNKHHEGDRKRWRDEVTERERKRYEAVWASNKGLHVPSFVPSWETGVCSLVAKDIFSRSRLHADVLEEMYTLIDRRKIGVLEREEFVVGLWLIDQRLKGRKLPIRVSDHVWKSVGALNGIKIRKAY